VYAGLANAPGTVASEPEWQHELMGQCQLRNTGPAHARLGANQRRPQLDVTRHGGEVILVAGICNVDELQHVAEAS